MGSAWFVRSKKGIRGPFSSSQLKEFAQQNQITRETMVCRGEKGRWVRAGEVKGLFKLPSDEVRQCETPSPARRKQPPHDKRTASPVAPVTGPSALPEPPVIKGSSVRVASTYVPPPERSRRRPATSMTVGVLLGVVIAATAGGVYYFTNGQGLSIFDRQLSTEEIVARSEDSVFVVHGRRSVGTGFAVADDIVVTNAHVIQSEFIDDIRLYQPARDNAKQNAKVPGLLYENVERDLALLQIANGPRPLSLANSDEFRRGQQLTIIGNPAVGSELVLENAISSGVMSTTTKPGNVELYQVSASINPGNSGGPAINDRGRVVGVVTLKAVEQQGIAFCVPASFVNDALNAIDYGNSPVAGAHPRHDSRVVFLTLVYCGEVYIGVLDYYVTSIRESIENGGMSDQGLAKARQLTEGLQLNETNASLDELRPSIGRVVRNQTLPDAARTKLVDLWANFQEIKSYVDEPRGSYNTYSAKARELKDNHKRLVEALSLVIGQ